MAAPELTHTGQQLYGSLAPLATEDARHGYALAHFLQALAIPFDEAADLSRDREDGTIGWGILFDVDRVPAKFLPYVGQFVGIDVPEHLDDAAKRIRVRETGNRNRGSAAAIIGAARQRLTGTRTVYLMERHGSPWRFTVATRTSETPNPALVAADVAAQKPAGMKFVHELITGGDYVTLRATHATYDELPGIFATYDELRADPARQ